MADTDRDSNVYMAKLAEQAERYDGKQDLVQFEVLFLWHK